jgi:hypothetical protein
MKEMTASTVQNKIMGFIADLKKDGGYTEFWASLPKNNSLVLTNKVRRFAKPSKIMACADDVLGNTIALCSDGIIRQFVNNQEYQAFRK